VVVGLEDRVVGIVDILVVDSWLDAVVWPVGSAVVPFAASREDSFARLVGLAGLAEVSYLVSLGRVAGAWTLVAALVAETEHIGAVVLVPEVLARIEVAETETVAAAAGFEDTRLALEVD
jgi:hypothetical protein